MRVLFSTPTGSRLYGLERDVSDYDYFTVVDKVKNRRARYSTQTIIDNKDSVTVDFGTWLNGCVKGVPQYLEAMFSQQPTEDNLGAFRAGYRVGTGVYDTYFRTIKSFALSEGFKFKRHALRLALNLNEMGRYGRFNPTLCQDDIDFINSMATKGNNDVYGLAKCIAW